MTIIFTISTIHDLTTLTRYPSRHPLIAVILDILLKGAAIDS
jgi:hypothetical protein